MSGAQVRLTGGLADVGVVGKSDTTMIPELRQKLYWAQLNNED